MANAKKKQRREFKLPPLMSQLQALAFMLFQNINFIFFLALLGIIYIANSHYAVETVKEIRQLQGELKKVSWESNARKSDLMYESMLSRVSQRSEHLGLKPLKGKPKKIEVKKE
ncbi:FtsL-like putative cell division protein [Saprospira grandis]|uniref:Cell division protein FtsL n=1 Tax=Saprospira grandis (strain Lewin) TaxID=984262 RepID=H6L2F4_SAPGL|nr:FtsL-like putative cell division protein [Saprospira grandis]AFC23612.1 hypothetical protein SGRA_0876 [Saprospira grandis str. Lewin]